MSARTLPCLARAAAPRHRSHFALEISTYTARKSTSPTSDAPPAGWSSLPKLQPTWIATTRRSTTSCQTPSGGSEATAGTEKSKLDLIRPYRAGGDLLEVGSEWGGFAYAAKLAGHNVTAVGMDERCCQYLRDIVGVAVYKPDETGVLPDGLARYDVVALWHVIEHLQHFEQVLSQLAGLVRPGGIIAIASPNPEAWQFRMMRKRWPHIDAPRLAVDSGSADLRGPCRARLQGDAGDLQRS